MSLHAVGADATIDMFEHHLVIRRRKRGVLLDGPVAEHLIPLSSIKSVQFLRPSFLSTGRIALVLVAGAAARPGTPADPNTVFFSKKQLAAFEQVLRAIQAAIATPSIERIAIASQQQRSIAPQQPDAHLGQLAQIGPATTTTQQSGHPDHFETADAQPEPSIHVPPPGQDGWWSDMPIVGKIILIGLVCFLLLRMCAQDSGVESSDTSAADNAASTASASEPTPEQMLGQWSEFVTGETGGRQFAITDGDGKPGEFCSASEGMMGMRFGRAPEGQGLQLFDYFYWSDAPRSRTYAGAFWFDKANRKLVARHLMQLRSDRDEGAPAADKTLDVAQVAPGVVSIDNTVFHICIL